MKFFKKVTLLLLIMIFCMLCLNPLSASAKSKNNVEKIGNSWFYTKNGHISSNYTGFGDNQYGTWYCRNRKLDYSATTVADGKNSRWLVQNGKVNYDYTGLCQVNDRYYQVSKGNVLWEVNDSSRIQLKSYYQEEMKKTIDTVKSLQTEPTLVFPLITDIHYMSNTEAPESIQDAIVNIGYFTREVPCLGVINLGDNTDGDTSQQQTLSRNNYLMQLFQGIGIPYYPCIGNHDDNRYKKLFNLDQIEKSYLQLTHDVVMDSSMSGTNYYKDLPDYKIRFIWLNANVEGRYGYSDKTVDWLENTALQTPDGYSICIFTHMDPESSHDYDNKYCYNGYKVQTLLAEYKNSGKEIIAMFSGHNHVDAAFTSPYLSIMTNCQRFENENGDPNLWPSGAIKPHRQLGTYTEDCWDVVVIVSA